MKRGSPLRRKTPLKRGDSELKRTRLERGKSKLKRRGVMEVHKDDPDRYGELFERVREMPCFGREHLRLHECGIGVRPATAHHLGKKDSEGMVPCCGRLHDTLHDRAWEVVSRLGSNGRNGKERLLSIGLEYVEKARAECETTTP